ncbi:hypothetical protein [Actinomadura decatromicini]|uniref:Uncharacterized protein n=1 Tax=Actinomadura decatromicini TaxID=2604572 RepID=A0A5D3F610_9ACTN|nr:hypothetical protein [Actinomadura decatromicini]TYK43751.1 hypothetical protein FXF68_37030 [Actinomadura decatromicini]
MNDFDFYASVVATGTVLGLDETCDTGDLAVRLGYDRDEGEAQKAYPVRHLGLVESCWTGLGSGRWHGVSLAVRVFTLHYGDVVPPAVREAYGPFRSAVRFPEFRDELESRGLVLEELPTQPGWRWFVQPDSQTAIWVDDGEPDPRMPTQPGDVHGIRMPAALPVKPRSGALRDATAAVRRMSPEDRVRWLAKRQPAAGPDRADWWAELFGAVLARLHGPPAQRAEWGRFGLWLLRQAESTQPFPPARAALIQAGLVDTLHELGLRDALSGELPPAEDVVRDCLAAMPMSRADAVPPRFASPDPSYVRRWREMKNMVDAALPHLPRTIAPDLASELRAWADLRATPLPLPDRGSSWNRGLS